MKNKIHRGGPYKVKLLPKNVKESWFYTGRHSSIHIVFHPVVFRSLPVDGFTIERTYQPEQLNIELPSMTLRKVKTRTVKDSK